VTVKALVVDDEAPARSELRFLLSEAGGVEVIGEASNATEALQLIRAIPYDVVFLDVEMPGFSGLRLAEVLGELEHPPAIVFVTAYSDAGSSACIAGSWSIWRRSRRSCRCTAGHSCSP